jgi:hypothetical protein
VYIEVSLGSAAVPLDLRHDDDFKALKVVVDGEGDWDDLALVLAGTARVDPPNVWIDIAALLTLGRGYDAAWVQGLDDMVAFARKRGWVDEAGAVRAHCEWVHGELPG